MSGFRQFWLRIAALVRRQAVEDDLDREVAAHLGLLEDEHRRRGLSQEDARRAARRALGSVALTKDLHRDARTFAWVHDAGRDLRYATRILARSPSFTAIAVLTLALGIGASTAVFSVVNGVLLRPLPYEESASLVRVYGYLPGVPEPLPAIHPQAFDALRSNTRTLSSAAAYISRSSILTGREEAVRLEGSAVSADLFPLLGDPLLGRAFEPGEELPGAEGAVVLSYATWQRYFEADPGGTYFAVRTQADPLAMTSGVRAVVQQLDPQATVDHVATMEQIVSSSIARPRLYTVLLGLFGAVAVALAGVGIYGVLAYVVAQRRQEIGIRMALGAPRARVVRLIVRQSAVLTVLGLSVGLATAVASSRYLEDLLFGVTPLDPATFVAAALTFALVALIAAWAPARRATRIDPLAAIRYE